MSYQEELQAKLDAVRPQERKESSTVDVSSLEENLVHELEEELELSRYDLDESDILRAIKITTILQSYKEAFANPNALRIFYILAKTDGITPKNLLHLSTLNLNEFKAIINTMSQKGLVRTEEKKLYLTLHAQSLAERIGVDVFI